MSARGQGEMLVSEGVPAAEAEIESDVRGVDMEAASAEGTGVEGGEM